MICVAPGLFSTITGWPSRSERSLPMLRAVTSLKPPASYGTMMRIGFDGKACARTEGAATTAAADAAQPMNFLRAIAIARLLSFCLVPVARGRSEAVRHHFGQGQ